MSKTVDMSDLSALSDDDLRYLWDRDQISDADYFNNLSAEDEHQNLSEPTPVEQIPNTGDANTRGETIEDLEARLAAMKAEQGEDEDGDEADDDEEDTDYVSMTNDELRAELVSRNLSVEGNKADLMARLEEDDEE